MFKRFISITFIAAATAILIAMGMVSHHHHGGAPCVERVMCELDGRINDEHTGHLPHDGQSTADNCVAENGFVRTMGRAKDHCSVPDCISNDHPHIIDAFFIVAARSLAAYDTSSGIIGYGEPVMSYRSTDVHSSIGLRGPPPFIS